MKWFSRFFWLKRTARTEVWVETCAACEGYQLVWLDGTPYTGSIRNARPSNVSPCRYCQGRGQVARSAHG